MGRAGAALLNRRSRAAAERLSAATALIGVGRLRRRVDIGKATSPAVTSTLRSRRRTAWGWLSRGASPLRSSRPSRSSSLVGLRMNICWLRSRRRGSAVGLARAQELQTSLDVRVAGVKLGSTLVSVQGIRDLVIARFVQSAEVIPDFGDVGVEADGSGVGIQSISVLVDLIVQDADRAPKRGVLTIPINRLLVRFVRLGVLLLSHVAPAEQVPTLSIRVIRADRLLEVLDGAILRLVVVALLVMQPTKLLKNLGVVGRVVEDPLVGGLGIVKVLLLLVNVTDLEPDVFLSQGTRWCADNVLEALVGMLAPILGESGCGGKGERNIPRDFVRTWTAACRLFQGGNKFRWPFRTQVGSA